LKFSDKNIIHSFLAPHLLGALVDFDSDIDYLSYGLI